MGQIGTEYLAKPELSKLNHGVVSLRFCNTTPSAKTEPATDSQSMAHVIKYSEFEGHLT
jgi:hypothetical protein